MATGRQTTPGHSQPARAGSACLIGLAGPFFNFLLTLGLMWFYFAFINEVPSVTVKTTTVEWVTPGSDAETAGIEAGDVIVRFDNVKNPDWEGVYDHARLNANQTVPVDGGS